MINEVDSVTVNVFFIVFYFYINLNNDIVPVDLTTSMWSDWATFDTDNGYTLASDCTWTKIGRIMIAQLIIKSNNGFTQPYGQSIATIKTKYRNMNIINTTCVLANNNWNVQPQSKLGSVYINNSGVMSINNQTPSDTTNIYARFTLVYALKNA